MREWVDAAWEKATRPNPEKRYEVLSEFIADLTCLNGDLLTTQSQRPLLERNPLAFWKWLAGVELVVILGLDYWLGR